MIHVFYVGTWKPQYHGQGQLHWRKSQIRVVLILPIHGRNSHKVNSGKLRTPADEGRHSRNFSGARRCGVRIFREHLGWDLAGQLQGQLVGCM